MLCCHHLEIGIIFGHEASRVDFALHPTNHVASAAQGWLFWNISERHAHCDSGAGRLAQESWLHQFGQPLTLSKSQFPHLWNGVNFGTCAVGSLCGLHETMHVKTPESCPPKQMFNVLAIVDLNLLWPWFFLQHIPNQYLYLVADQYFYNKHSPVEIRDSFLDLLGDVFFVVPGVVTARYHRGESLSTPIPHPTAGSQSSKASGCSKSYCLTTGHLLHPTFLQWEGVPEDAWDTTLHADLCNSCAFQSSGILIRSDVSVSSPGPGRKFPPPHNLGKGGPSFPDSFLFRSVFPSILAIRNSGAIRREYYLWGHKPCLPSSSLSSLSLSVSSIPLSSYFHNFLSREPTMCLTVFWALEL